jgi:hypothetical protein
VASYSINAGIDIAFDDNLANNTLTRVVYNTNDVPAHNINGLTISRLKWMVQ